MTDLYIPDCIFPTDNDAEIPTLRLDMQPEFVDIPFVCFGEQKRTFQMNGCGTLHFYTDDYRFSVLYEHPDKILNHNPRNIVEPNFSLFNEMPIAFGLQAIYKKRFIARAMQERGVDDGINVEESKAFLSDHKKFVSVLIVNVRCSTEWKKKENLHLVSLAWMEERCERRIKKMGY